MKHLCSSNTSESNGCSLICLSNWNLTNVPNLILYPQHLAQFLTHSTGTVNIGWTEVTSDLSKGSWTPLFQNQTAPCYLFNFLKAQLCSKVEQFAGQTKYLIRYLRLEWLSESHKMKFDGIKCNNIHFGLKDQWKKCRSWRLYKNE